MVSGGASGHAPMGNCIFFLSFFRFFFFFFFLSDADSFTSDF
jgi:hypothetical protein